MTRAELQQMKLFQLKRLAAQAGVPGRSSMSKDQLVSALAARKLDLKKKARPKRRTVAKTAAARTSRKPAAPRPRPAAAASRAAQKPAHYPPPSLEAGELPGNYLMNKLVLLPRDPNWLFAYWELTPERFDSARAQLGIPASKSRMILRVHDVTDLLDPLTGEARLDRSKNYTTIDLAPMSDQWYVQVPGSNRSYCAECLLVAPDGRTISLLVSNVVSTPADRVSDISDEEWGTLERLVVSRSRGAGRTKWLQELAPRAAATSPRGWSPGRWSPGTRG